MANCKQFITNNSKFTPDAFHRCSVWAAERIGFNSTVSSLVRHISSDLEPSRKNTQDTGLFLPDAGASTHQFSTEQVTRDNMSGTETK